MTPSGKTSQSSQALAEIMRRAGVSKATVLRVLNGDHKGAYPRVAKRHALIRQLADELNYRPSYAGRTISRNRTHTIGLLYPRHDPMLAHQYAQTVHALARTLGAEGYDLALHAVGEEETDRSDLLLGRRFDAYAVHDRVPAGVLEAVRRANLPAVTINAGEHEGMSSVSADDIAGTRMLTEKLLDIGHTRIVYINKALDPTATMRHVSIAQRQQGYTEAMEAAGLSPMVWHATDQEPSERYLMSHDRPTAMVVYATDDAADIVYRITDEGVSVPNDLSVVATNDTSSGTTSRPQLTIMRVPFQEFGEQAGRLLLEALASDDPLEPQHIMLPEQYVERRSMAPPPAD